VGVQDAQVPEMIPALLRVNPVGRDPEVTAQVYGAVPPAAVSAMEKAVQGRATKYTGEVICTPVLVEDITPAPVMAAVARVTAFAVIAPAPVALAAPRPVAIAVALTAPAPVAGAGGRTLTRAAIAPAPAMVAVPLLVHFACAVSAPAPAGDAVACVVAFGDTTPAPVIVATPWAMPFSPTMNGRKTSFAPPLSVQVTPPRVEPMAALGVLLSEV
jgi:hypothetical protein